MAEQTLKCKKCGKNYPTSEMKYFRDITNLFCVKCYKETLENAKKQEGEEKLQQTQKEKRVKYKCAKCNYSFIQSRSYDRGCPYCGSQKVVLQEVTGNVDKLIAESSQGKYD